MEDNLEHKLFLAPYHYRDHWVMVILNPHLDHAYWVDPLQTERSLDAEELVTMSYILTYAKLGKKKPRIKTFWHHPKCPRHSNEVDCGYYVLKFMRDVISQGKLVNPSKWFDKKTEYKQEEIDELRKEWLNHLFTVIFKQG